jgi:methylenetetrahydrofolate dehydrogenase (NADP+)/methenyltetrahydrofolate cyclohydrolase
VLIDHCLYSQHKIDIMELIDGKALSNTIKDEIASEVLDLCSGQTRPPHLAAVLVGDDPASAVYVKNKVASCEKCGFESTLIKKRENTTEAELLEIVRELNEDEDVDGFIVQLPLPKHIDEHKITLAINPEKDVDGFHPTNFGKMAQGLPAYLPATPFGIMTMLDRYNIEVQGKNCVVLGRSNIVGTPISILLSRKAKPGNATVTLCHSRTKNLAEYTKKADIIVIALGIPNYLKGDMIKDGVVIIDVGINRIDAPERKRGSRLVGDADFDSVAPKCSHITPVPGGVGPMTVTSLLTNTLKAYKKNFLNQA